MSMEAIEKNSEFIALIIMILTYMLREWWKNRFEKPEEEKVMAILIKDHELHRKKLENIEKFTGILANQYTTTFPMPMIERMVKQMFSNSRFQIYSTVLDWVKSDILTSSTNIYNLQERVRKMVSNMYSNDCEFLSSIDFKGQKLSVLMDEAWRDMIINTSISFLESHIKSGNDYDKLRIDLKNDFEYIENEFIKKLRL